MQTHIETDRLLIRELMPEDAEGIFELDSDPEVHLYLGNNPIKTMEQAEEAIKFIRQQYLDNGIGRWAVIEKTTNAFIGWSGLKFMKETVNEHNNYYDLGYRFMKKYWGKGYATETAIASLNYGFNELKLPEIFAMADVQNTLSNAVLSKAGLKFIELFHDDGIPHNWYKITREEWNNKTSA
ncbi:MAG: GNAT family N-acetyltransferase [Taibaiella sp.]|jgi:RimJ/RimL family protein N-acetyltransferase